MKANKQTERERMKMEMDTDTYVLVWEDKNGRYVAVGEWVDVHNTYLIFRFIDLPSMVCSLDGEIYDLLNAEDDSAYDEEQREKIQLKENFEKTYSNGMYYVKIRISASVNTYNLFCPNIATIESLEKYFMEYAEKEGKRIKVKIIDIEKFFHPEETEENFAKKFVGWIMRKGLRICDKCGPEEDGRWIPLEDGEPTNKMFEDFYQSRTWVEDEETEENKKELVKKFSDWLMKENLKICWDQYGYGITKVGGWVPLQDEDKIDEILENFYQHLNK